MVSCATAPSPTAFLTTPYIPVEGRAFQVGSHTRDNQDFVTIPAGESLTLAELEGPAMITRLWFALALRVNQEQLRQIILRAWWDGEESPSVEVPFGDFFGDGFAANGGVNSLFFGQNSGAFYCYWPMPFRKSARLTLTNETNRDVTVYYQVTGRDDIRLPRNTMTFHSQWRRQDPVPEGEPFVALETSGSGTLMGYSLAMQGAYTGVKTYLEGDESIFIDGEEMPSLAGTGLEDAFNHAWYFLEGPSSRLFHGNPRADKETSRYSAYRIFGPDPVPFRESVRLEIEHANRYNTDRVDYAATTYWYQQEPHEPFPALPTGVGRSHSLPRPIFQFPDVIEAESFLPGAPMHTSSYCEEVSNFHAIVFDSAFADTDGGYSHNVYAFSDSEYEVGASFVTSSSCGIWAVEVDGQRVGKPVDTWSEQEMDDTLTARNRGTGAIILDRIPTKRGPHTIRLVPVGADARAITKVFNAPGLPPQVIPSGSLILDCLIWRGPGPTVSLEGEDMAIKFVTGGNTTRQSSPSLHKGAQLWWREPRIGDRLDMRLPVGEAGEYELLMQFQRAYDYGTFQVFLDEIPIGDPVDFYSDRPQSTGLLSFGRHNLAAGEHSLSFVSTGRNAAATPRFIMGFDYMVLNK